MKLWYQSMSRTASWGGDHPVLKKILDRVKDPDTEIEVHGIAGVGGAAPQYRYLEYRRMFWGTDLSKLSCTYRQAVTMITEEIDWMSPDDKAWIMGLAVCQWTGWPPALPIATR